MPTRSWRRAGAVLLTLAGAAALAFAAFDRAGEFALIERPWEASALTWAALLGLAGAVLTPRSGLAAGLIALAAAWAALVISRLGEVPNLVLVGAALLALAGLLALARSLRRRPRRTLLVLALAASAVALLTVAGIRIHGVYLGPTHPSSPLRPQPVDLVEWAWAGAVTPTSFAVTAQLPEPARAADPSALALVVRAASDGAVVGRFAPARISPAGVARFEAAGLEPGARYRWAVAVDGREDRYRTGTLRTFPVGPASFIIAFGACASTGSNGQVFDRIREAEPLLFIHTGDFHYADIDANDPAAIRRAYARSLRAPAQQALWLTAPVAYTWDDHDYGGNDADRTTASRDAARSVYREIVPHYPLPLDGPIAQAFTVGRVRVILTDSRSERAPSSAPDGPGKSMLGDVQLAWLFDELLRARDTAALIVWVNSVPWISSSAGGDDWGAYAEERRQIADFIVEHGIRNLVMLSGDAHMLAADSGANNRFAAGGAGPGFPVYHAGALDRRGSVKGGPYSEGARPGGGQFGLLAVDDRGDAIEVTFSGRNWRGEELIRHAVTFAVEP